MTALSYLAQRFPGFDLEPETNLTEIPGFDAIDRQTLASEIDETRPVGAPFVTDHELEAWATIADVLATATQFERQAA